MLVCQSMSVFDYLSICSSLSACLYVNQVFLYLHVKPSNCTFWALSLKFSSLYLLLLNCYLFVFFRSSVLSIPILSMILFFLSVRFPFLYLLIICMSFNLFSLCVRFLVFVICSSVLLSICICIPLFISLCLSVLVSVCMFIHYYSCLFITIFSFCMPISKPVPSLSKCFPVILFSIFTCLYVQVHVPWN